ncbi:MAG TPA: CRTAC1 family protein [Thermoanaerobaculia bacterium]
MRRSLFLLAASLAGLGFALSPATAAAPETPTPVLFPAHDDGVATLAARKAEQEAAAKGWRAFHDFRYSDRLAESGITFVHQATQDSTKYYKPNHYDHGTGVSAADVDGDGLADLYFVNQIGGNQLWKNLGGGRFRDITAAAGVGVKDRVGVTASFADTDNDGDQDLFVTTVRGGDLLFENDGKGRFRDISKAAGLDYVGHSSGAVFFDYDNDGLLDLFLANVGKYTSDERGPGGYFVGFADAFQGHLKPERTEKSRLYRNTGKNRFVDVTEAVSLPYTGWSGDASFTDFNGDGFPDLYVLNMQGHDHYLENRAGKTFVDRTSEHFPKTPWGAMGIKFFDYDNDGKIDLLITDMHSDMSEHIGPEREKLKSRMQWSEKLLQGGADSIFGNALWHNLGGGRFEEVSDKAGVENYWPWGTSVGDLNADGFQDVFIASSMCFPFRYGINSLLLNEAGGRFVDAEFVLGIEPRKDGRTHTAWFEADCATEDGKSRRACEGQTGKIVVMGAIGTRASAIFDIDGDGDLDIVTNDFNSAPQVLVSDLASRQPVRFVQIALEGAASNRNGLGAAVTVTADGKAYTQVQDGKSGYLSQSVLPLYFGLGEARRVERIEVRWPSGRKSVLDKDIALNRTIPIAERR